MIKIYDNIVGEIIALDNWSKAEQETERRVSIHQSEWFSKRGKHYATECEVIYDKEKGVITINPKQ